MPGKYFTHLIIGTCLGDGGIDINLGDRRTFSTDICSVLAWPLEQNTVDWELKTTGYFVVGGGGVGFVCLFCLPWSLEVQDQVSSHRSWGGLSS